MKVPFDVYAPDLPELGAGSATIKNCIPTGAGYRKFPSASVFSDALDELAQGLASGKDNDGNAYNYAGTASYLYRLIDSSWSKATKSVTGTDISFTAPSTISSTSTDFSNLNDDERITVSGSTSNDGTYTISGTPGANSITVNEVTLTTEAAGDTVTVERTYNTGDSDLWNFVKWNTQIIGTNGFDQPQSITLGGTEFDLLHADAPVAKCLGVVANDFLVLGYVGSPGAEVSNRIQWSGNNDLTSWGTVPATQADFNDMKGDGGAIQHISSGYVGYVFQEHSIQVMRYIGPPVVFQIDEVEPRSGTPAKNSVARIGPFAFYLGHDGFKVFNGSNSQSIGIDKVDLTFWDEVDKTYLHRVYAAIDVTRNIVMWAYPTTAATNGNPDKILCYNWKNQRWSFLDQTCEILSGSLSSGYTMETLDNLNSSIDALTITLDSDFYKGGAQQMSMFDTSHQMNNFTGTAMAAVVQTAELNPLNREVFFNMVRPLTDATCTLKVYTRGSQQDSQTASSAYSLNSYDSTFSVREDSRYFKFELTTSGDFDYIQGIEFDPKKSGDR